MTAARGIVIAAALGAVVWAVLALSGWGACTAAGAPTMGAQAVSDRTAQVLSGVLRTPVPARRLVATNAMWRPTSDGEVWPTRLDEYRLRPETAAWATQGYATHRIGGRPVMPALYTVIHELLHRDVTVQCWPEAPDDFGAEEGIVDAVTIDVGPTVAYRVWGLRGISFFGRYPREIAAIRAASVRATGSVSWRNPAARIWRYELWRQDCGGRRQMLVEAAQA